MLTWAYVASTMQWTGGILPAGPPIRRSPDQTALYASGFTEPSASTGKPRVA